MDTRVVVAMSGGVDSAVTAALLQEEGYGVVGVTLKVWGHVAETPVPHPPQSCCTPEAFEDARLMAAHLGIPHYLLNVEREFETHVITPFCQEYAVGRTPLPCAACNTEVKFGSLLRRALAWGAEFVATGHYARTGVDQTTGRILLKRGIDPDKDQSYFLYGLTQSQLRRIRFPLGTMRKGDVRALAAQKGLRAATKPDSQELCFLPEGDYRALLRERHPGAIRPGIIRDQTGQVLGTHEGIPLYTIGQRRGLKIGGRGPYYVVALAPGRNEVVVGREEDLQADTLVADRVNFIPFDRLNGERSVLASIRYRHPPAEAVISPMADGRVLVQFARPLRAITPGQAVVFYEGKDPDLVLGGGTIQEVLRRTPPNSLM
ncbi:MAG: tRNA 2-thiouridine(34) synthase MnmA [Candidatus Methylomirabilales bacterium]|jgi:tRNA-specific 2-thiouridylase|nr:tRNA 2-thiouridine(34) synthase MnmA [candidate division NC10 bacterium]